MAVNVYKPYGYAITLRAVGAWLDEQRPAYFTVFETPDGMSVVVSVNEPEIARNEAHVAFGALAAQHEQLSQRRGVPREIDELACLFPTGRQDFLHALGFELDQAGAEAIVIDQLDDAVMLSYAYVDPGADFSWHKRMAVLNADEITMITKVARARRRPEDKAGFLSGFRRQRRSG
jgi:hypothetical protein